MARIRTVKPEFFRHESLQDLEAANPGKYVMLIYAGLWGHCDSKGRFEWRPRQLKLDILPFLTFSMDESLTLIERAGLINRYCVDGKTYGEIPTFEKHQRITGKEASEGEKFPANTGETIGKQSGNNRDIPESQEGNGREEEGKRKEEKERTVTAPASPAPGENIPDPTETALQAACKETLRAYGNAYLDRYGTAPVVNAKIRGQVKQFVQRIGHEESPLVAAFFLTHQESFYVKKCHDFGLALHDAEKLRTEWATRRMVTNTSAQQADRTGNMMSIVDEIMAERSAA